LGQKCREEKRECDKKMRETAKLEGEKTKCEEKLADLDDQIANYAAVSVFFIILVSHIKNI